MDALERQCIAGFLVDSRFAPQLASPPSRSRRSRILVPFRTQKLGGSFSVNRRRPPIILPGVSSSSFPSDAGSYEVQADEKAPDSPTETTDSSKTVHVRFVLQKECSFGQQFFIVGDHPMFGLWDPTNAVPLEWSADHVWATELNLPAGKTILFKFILRGLAGDVNWQPGPNRCLQTWETTKTIVVSEDWDNAVNQKIAEEQQTLIMVDEPLSAEVDFSGNDRMVMDQAPALEAQDNVSQTLVTECEGDLLLVPGLTPIPASGSASGSSEETMEANVPDTSFKSDEAEHCDSAQLTEEQQELIMVDESLSLDVNLGGNSRVEMDQDPSFEAQDNVSQTLVTEGDGELLLVPGSAPIPAFGNASASLQETMEANVPDASFKSDEDEHCDSPQSSGEGDKSEEGSSRDQIQEEAVLLFQRSNETERAESIDGVTNGGKNVLKEADHEPMPGIIDKSIQWVRRAIKRFLVDLGIIMP